MSAPEDLTQQENSGAGEMNKERENSVSRGAFRAAGRVFIYRKLCSRFLPEESLNGKAAIYFT